MDEIKNKKFVISPETGLSSLQERCALLLASGTRITDISEQLPVCKTTIYKWLRSDVFKCYLNLMKKDLLNSITGNVLGLKDKALEGLKASLESDNEQVRLKASIWVIDKLTLQEVGETDARRILQERASEEREAGTWKTSENEAGYRKKLKQAGLDE
mgnify:CR=1 FL=1